MTIAESFIHNGYTVEIHYDESGTFNPRDDTDCNVGLFLGRAHRRYDIGDEQWDPEYEREDLSTNDAVVEYLKIKYGATVVLPVSLYDHGGVTYTVGLPTDPWDSGLAGWILDTAESRKKTGVLDNIEQALRAEIAEYSAWASGEVYGYVIKDINGDVVDSCWGFINSSPDMWNYLLVEAREAVPSEPVERLITLRLPESTVRAIAAFLPKEEVIA